MPVIPSVGAERRSRRTFRWERTTYGPSTPLALRSGRPAFGRYRTKHSQALRMAGTALSPEGLHRDVFPIAAERHRPVVVRPVAPRAGRLVPRDDVAVR